MSRCSMLSTSKFYLTADRLRANDACEPDVLRFEQVFGSKTRVGVNDENFERAIAARLPIWWLAYKYLSSDEYMRLDAAAEDAPSHPDYERNARRYWAAIRRKMERDNVPRPEAWY